MHYLEIGFFANKQQSCGCGIPVENHDIQNGDSAADTIAQIQEAFKFDALADFPVVSKKPEFKSFRGNLVEFYNLIIHNAAESGKLYDNERFMEDLKIWFTVMSSSNLRSFRHTSTLVLLTILTQLCRLHVSASQSANQQEKIITAERKKARSSKARLKAAQDAIDFATSKKDKLEYLMRDIFDTVFVHRYRDIDPKIRAECIRELGQWMDILPSFFFELQYLRYFGWLLSDTHGSTRLEVVKSLLNLYSNKDNIIGFRQFTERFRSRLVEMSVVDADINVRVATIDLLSVLRDVGFLEEEDVALVAHLIYDTELRVRKAAARFITGHVGEQTTNAHQEFNASKLNQLKKKFPQLEDSWLAFKEFSTLLKSEPNDKDESLLELETLYSSPTSRVSLAGAALWEEGMGKDWPSSASEHLFDYSSLVRMLLFDFSSLDSEATDSHSKRFVELYTLDTPESLILLEVLYGFIRGNLNVIQKKKTSDNKRNKLSDADLEEAALGLQEELMKDIPLLLDNYSHIPDATAHVLRLHELLDLDIYRHLHSESRYTELVDQVIKQFKTHRVSVVIEACASVFMKATSGEDALAFSGDVRSKVQDLLEDVSAELRSVLVSSPAFSTTPSKSNDAVVQYLIEPLVKMDYLSRALDIHKMLEMPLEGDSESASDNTLLVDKLKEILSITSMYPADKSITVLLVSVSNLLCSYIMWKLGALVDSAVAVGAAGSGSSNQVDLSAKVSDFATEFIQELELIVQQAETLHIRSLCAKTLLDLLVTVNVTIAQVSSITSNDTARRSRLFDLPCDIADGTQMTLIGLFLKKEKAYAQIANVELEKGPNDSAYYRELNSQLHNTQDETEDRDSDVDDADDPETVLSQLIASQVENFSQLTGSQGAAQAQVLDHEKLFEKTRAVSTYQQRVLLLDHDLCQFTAKLRVAGLAQLIKEEHASRLVLNTKVLSTLYGKIVGANIKSDEPATSAKQASARTKKSTNTTTPAQKKAALSSTQVVDSEDDADADEAQNQEDREEEGGADAAEKDAGDKSLAVDDDDDLDIEVDIGDVSLGDVEKDLAVDDDEAGTGEGADDDVEME